MNKYLCSSSSPFYSLEEMNSGQQKRLDSTIQNVLSKHMVSRLFQRLNFYVFFKKHIIPYLGKNIKTLILFLPMKHCVTTSLLLMMKKGACYPFDTKVVLVRFPSPQHFIRKFVYFYAALSHICKVTYPKLFWRWHKNLCIWPCEWVTSRVFISWKIYGTTTTTLKSPWLIRHSKGFQ